jgi:hypothetical protein
MTTTVVRKDRFAILLNDWPSSRGELLLPSSAQLVLNGRANGSYSELTGQLAVGEILASVDSLKAELDALADEALFAIVSRAAQQFERRRSSNDNGLLN